MSTTASSEKKPEATEKKPAPPAPGTPAGPEKAPEKPSFIKEKLSVLGPAIKTGLVETKKGIIEFKTRMFSDFPILVKSLISPDSPTRKMSVLFFLSLIGFCSVLVVASHRYWHFRRAAQLKESKRMSQLKEEAARKEAEKHKRKDAIFSLGQFSLELKSNEPTKRGAGFVNMAEVEIVVFCDEKATRDYIEDHKIQARDQISSLLTPLDRSDLMSLDGKRRLKGVVLRRLNQWLPKGKIEDLYFSNQVLH